MRLLAALSAAVLVYLVLGAAFGISPRFLNKAQRPARRTRLDRAQEWLVQAGALVTPAQFIAVSVAVGAVVGVIMHLVAAVAPLTLGAAVLAALLPRAFFARRRARIARERIAAWPDTIRDLIAHLRASMSVHAALVELGRSGPPVMRPYFGRYARLASTLDSRTALGVVRGELADPVSDRVIEIILVAFEQGSSVVIDVLADLASATAGDIALHDEIETAQLEVKIESRGAALMPFVVLIMLVGSSDEFAAFYRSPAGWLVIAVGGMLCTGGLFAISRLGAIPTESRIIGSAVS